MVYLTSCSGARGAPVPEHIFGGANLSSTIRLKAPSKVRRVRGRSKKIRIRKGKWSRGKRLDKEGFRAPQTGCNPAAWARWAAICCVHIYLNYSIHPTHQQ